MLASDWPTNLSNISGPLITLGSRASSILPICLAIRVLPVPARDENECVRVSMCERESECGECACLPGGPNSSIPLTCFIPVAAQQYGNHDNKATHPMKLPPQPGTLVRQMLSGI